MPLHWKVDSRERLVTIVAEGDVTRNDVDAFLGVLDGAGLVPYRKLLDGTDARTSMTAEDLMAIGVRIRAGHEKGPVGALGVVLSAETAQLLSRLLGIMASAQRPMRMFDNVEDARRWLIHQSR